MRFVGNEKGYALLMVLILMLLFTVIGMGLLAMNMNAAKQFNTKEEQVQARHQAEMGVLHYEAILKDKVRKSSTVALTCNDFESLLGTSKKIVNGNYSVMGASTSGSSCKAIEEGKKLEISIKSVGSINNSTKKEVLAKFYARNDGGNNEIIKEKENVIEPPLKEPNSGSKVDSLSLTKHSGVNASTFPDSLSIKSVLSTGTGFETILKVNKHLYIQGTVMTGNPLGQSLDMNNHACIGVGGDFTALTQIDWGGQSSIELLIRKDAFFPSNIINWKSDKTKVFIFGDLYLPRDYKYFTHNNQTATRNDIHTFIGGKVYQSDSAGKYKEIQNPFHKLETNQITQANSLSCAVPEMGEEIGNTPNWILQDNIDINYQ